MQRTLSQLCDRWNRVDPVGFGLCRLPSPNDDVATSKIGAWVVGGRTAVAASWFRDADHCLCYRIWRFRMTLHPAGPVAISDRWKKDNLHDRRWPYSMQIDKIEVGITRTGIRNDANR